MDLTTNYMGLQLKNPLVASASPLTGALDSLRQIEDAGAGAVVLPSLFQEEIEAEAARYDHLTTVHDDSWPEGVSNFPTLAEAQHGPHQYLELVRKASEVLEVPVIASLNGITNKGWTAYAKQIEQAGAKGLELNIYFLTADFGTPGFDVERRYLDIVKSVRAAVSIPLAVKLSPYFSSVGNMAMKLQEAGADALVLFNRFYQPDLDLVRLEILSDLRLSESYEIRFPLLWIAFLSGGTRTSLAASSGVTSADEVVKYLLVGADVVMTTSALLRRGPRHMATLLTGLETWLEARDFTSLERVRGIMNQRNMRDPQAFERANYIKILQGYQPPDPAGILDPATIKLLEATMRKRHNSVPVANEAIRGAVRTNASGDTQAPSLHLANDVLHILHGARRLPPAEAVAALQPFLNAMYSRVSGHDRLADASAAAVGALVQRLESQGVANDDLWQVAIDSSVSFANEGR